MFFRLCGIDDWVTFVPLSVIQNAPIFDGLAEFDFQDVLVFVVFVLSAVVVSEVGFFGSNILFSYPRVLVFTLTLCNWQFVSIYCVKFSTLLSVDVARL